MALNLRESFRGARGVLTAAALAGSAILGIFPAAAQQALNPQQCSEAQDFAFAIMNKYPVSPSMATSFRNFRTSKCDLDTDFATVTPVDEKAFGEFRLKLIALRKSASLGVPQLAKQ